MNLEPLQHSSEKHFYEKHPGDRGLRFLLIALIALGIGFRCVELDTKVYWADEAFTSLRISGYSLAEVGQAAYSDRTFTVAEFQKYQHLNADKNLTHTVSGLMAEEPQLTPLYFVFVRLWAQVFGTSMVAIRSLSVGFGLFALPAMYWLGLALSQSRLVALCGTALLAVSPFHVIYAQEARPYSLLTLMILLSSIVFLRALRQPTRRHWVLYSITVTLGLYTHLLFMLSALAHGVYLLLWREGRKHLGRLTIALTLSILPVVPWLVGVALNKAQAQAMTGWSTDKLTLNHLIAIWAGNISRIFFDLGINSSLVSKQTILLLSLPILLLLLLSVYALYFVQRHAPPAIWGFIWTQIGVTIVLLWLPDLVLGSRVSTGGRYMIGLWLNLQLAVAYLLVITLTRPKFPHRGLRAFWPIVAVAIFASGVVSSGISVPAALWWHKSPQYTRHILPVSALINQAPAPLVAAVTATDGDLMRVEALGYYLKPDVQLRFFNATNIDAAAAILRDRHAFVYLPNPIAQPVLKQLERALKQTGHSALQAMPNTDDALFQTGPK
jgi:uncharacterized membrane protein